MTRWWQPPQLRRDEDEGRERKVGFIELFYDLIFVVAVAQLAHGLAEHPDWRGVGTFLLLFTAVWWLWIGNTFYTDRFETEDVSHRLVVFLQMIPVVGLAVFAHAGIDEAARGFALSYIAGRLLIIFLWWRGGHHEPAARPATKGYVTGFSIGLAFWVAGLFVGDHLRIAFWVVGLAIDLATPSLLFSKLRILPRFSHSKLEERFGLFTIIVLGETVAGSVNGLAGLGHFGAREAATAVLAMALAFAFWWLYFEMVPRERLKPTMAASLGRSYAHLPLLAAVAASGAGVLHVVGHGGGMLDDDGRRLLAGSIAVALAGLIALSRVHVYQVRFGRARLRTEVGLGAALVAALLLAVFADGWTGLEILGALVAALYVPVLWGIWRWARIQEPVAEATIAVQESD